jgi:N6-adenosine-specific RNA methylase IME4
MGECNKLEMFARDKEDNWDIWGNELENDIKLD